MKMKYGMGLDDRQTNGKLMSTVNVSEGVLEIARGCWLLVCRKERKCRKGKSDFERLVRVHFDDGNGIQRKVRKNVTCKIEIDWRRTLGRVWFG